MTNTTTISKPAGGTITLQGDSKAFVVSNTASVEAVFISTPKYGSDPSETDVLDYGGAVKIITLEGIYVDTMANIKTFVESCEALINGIQSKSEGYPLTFTDTLRGTKLVKVMNFMSTLIEGEATTISWTLKLIESSNNS